MRFMPQVQLVSWIRIMHCALASRYRCRLFTFPVRSVVECASITNAAEKSVIRLGCGRLLVCTQQERPGCMVRRLAASQVCQCACEVVMQSRLQLQLVEPQQRDPLAKVAGGAREVLAPKGVKPGLAASD